MKPPKSARLLTYRHLENLADMLKTLLEEEQLTDVTLHCKDGSIKAHKVVLAASSPYFRRILVEHKDNVALVMHGISRERLKKIIEVIYYGCAEINIDATNVMCELVDELDLTGVVVVNENNEKDDKANGHGRDTRFKGQKRVTVDFNESSPKPAKQTKQQSVDRLHECSKSDNGSASDSNNEPSDPNDLYTVSKEEIITPKISEVLSFPPGMKMSSWDKKPRKFNCDLCPSSFKRASHLTRHQLVHTGERPFACKYCDKAFSRHDKLKHHIRKNHDLDPDYVPNELLRNSTYSIGTVGIPSPTMHGSHYEPNYDDDNKVYASNYRKIRPKMEFSVDGVATIPLVVKSNATSTPVTSTNSSGNSFNGSASGQKKRGRPRKYPPVPPPLIKRPRGRPRLNPIVPSNNPSIHSRQNYDYTNLPFGDLEFLTKPLHDDLEQPIMEPLVEIKTEEGEQDTTTPKITNVCTASDRSCDNLIIPKTENISSDLLPEVTITLEESGMKDDQPKVNTESEEKSQETITEEENSAQEESTSTQSNIDFLSGIGLTAKIGECTVTISDQ